MTCRNKGKLPLPSFHEPEVVQTGALAVVGLPSPMSTKHPTPLSFLGFELR